MRGLFLAFLLTASPLLAQQQSSAYDALRVVGTQLGRGAINHVISLTGVDGDPQPVTWRVLLADGVGRDAIREVEVTNGRIVAQRAPSSAVVGSTQGAAIKTARLNLDSSGAFSVASYTADKAHTNFALVSYTLRNDQRGNPIWVVTLQDESRRPIGTIHIGANRGNVTRVEGMYRGANMAQVEQDRGYNAAPQVNRRAPEQHRNREIASADEDVYAGDEVDDADDGDVNPVKKEIKQMFRRTKHGAERMFGRVRRSFDEFFYRN